MTTAYQGVIDDEQITIDQGGITAVRTIVLSGVTGNRAERVWRATQDAKIPKYGAPHPVIPDIKAWNIQAQALDVDKVSVTVTYSLPDGGNDEPYDPGQGEPQGVISLSSAIMEEATNFDRDGRPLIVRYTGTLLDSEGNEVQVEGDQQIAEVQVARPMVVIAFTRKENGSPVYAARDLVGTINRDQLGPFPVKTLMCTRVDANSEDGGFTSSVTYEFQFNPAGWAQDVAYIDPETDRPPPDATLGNGLARYDFYREVSFEPLGLPWNAPRRAIGSSFLISI